VLSQHRESPGHIAAVVLRKEDAMKRILRSWLGFLFVEEAAAASKKMMEQRSIHWKEVNRLESQMALLDQLVDRIYKGGECPHPEKFEDNQYGSSIKDVQMRDGYRMVYSGSVCKLCRREFFRDPDLVHRQLDLKKYGGNQ